jgi:hypothetical protein
MSKAKPTPMPWELRGWSIKHPGNGFRICVVEQPDKGLRQFGGGDYDDMMAECKANAELIASAPMLAHANQEQAKVILDLKERLAAAESKEVCTVAHDDCVLGVGESSFCPYCEIERLINESEEMRQVRLRLYDERDKLKARLSNIAESNIAGELDAVKWRRAVKAALTINDPTLRGVVTTFLERFGAFPGETLTVSAPVAVENKCGAFLSDPCTYPDCGCHKDSADAPLTAQERQNLDDAMASMDREPWTVGSAGDAT